MTMPTICQDIRGFLSSGLQREVGTVSDSESLLEAGIVDSLGVLSLVAFIEEQYSVQVSEDEMVPENFDSIEAMAAFVMRSSGTPVA
jgi:acyl carrier protein